MVLAGKDEVKICRLSSVNAAPQILEEIDEIFFTSSLTQDFSSPEARLAFRERWLGRYLAHDPQWFYLAICGGRVAGYLAGAVDDPAKTERFRDIGYFQIWSAHTATYPAHLHVNVLASFRGNGIGSLLIERFVEDLENAGVKGVHLVTGRNSRNVVFYQRNGFEPVADMSWHGSEIVMLGRLLSAARAHN